FSLTKIPSNLPPCRSRFQCRGWVFRFPFRHSEFDKPETFIVVCQWLSIELDREVFDSFESNFLADDEFNNLYKL
uniref:Uncharacterized protein n=1 Tax=Cucumis melo TaxID=3656 RepID=A0A9I9EI72_CUCME